MFDDCYLRLGRSVFASCMPLTPSLLGSLYALPERVEKPVREALERLSDDQPWSESLATAPEQTAAAVGAMLRRLMMATSDLDAGSINTHALPKGGRARLHIEALRDLWISDPAIVPADLAKLRDFLACESTDALQSMDVIWDREWPSFTPLERVVLERLECHHGRSAKDDRDNIRLITDRKSPAAPEASLVGHIQRSLLEPHAVRVPADDSLAVLAVRDALTECEAAAAIIQHWLASDASLNTSDIGVIIPTSSDYALYLGLAFEQAGLVASSLPALPQRRNIGAEAVLHFVQCRRRPAPAMALASLYCSPVMGWPAEVGTALAASVMDGDFQPKLARSLTGRSSSLFTLIRSDSSATTAQLKDHLRTFARLLSEDVALVPDVLEVKQQITSLIAAFGSAADSAEPDWEKAIQFAAAYPAVQGERGAYFLGGIATMLAHEAPKRRFRKLLILGFNDGAYPSRPGGNPFFLDSEMALICERTNIELPSQARKLDAALALFTRQISAATEQVIILLSERDRNGGGLSPSSSLPLISRLVEGVVEPEKLVIPIARGAGTIWDRLIAWRPCPDFELAERPEIPVHYELGLDLLALRKKDDGTTSAQSPSRLEKLLVSPLAWLLGELGAAHVAWKPETLDVMLRGSLAHEVFERLFVVGTNHPEDATIEAQVPDLLLDRIRALAPFLQTTAWVVERNTIEAEIIKAAKHWSMVLKSLNAEIIGNEFWLAGSLFGHPVHGKADCLLRLPDGQPVVVDYKKSSSGTRRLRLQKGWDLQVDLYRRMAVRVDERSHQSVAFIADALSAWKKNAAVAYHTLNDGNVLLNGMDELDSAHVEILPGNIAENALALIGARFEALKAGRLETNTKADEKFFQKTAALGTYALSDSPLINAFMRADTVPSHHMADKDHD